MIKNAAGKSLKKSLLSTNVIRYSLKHTLKHTLFTLANITWPNVFMITGLTSGRRESDLLAFLSRREVRRAAWSGSKLPSQTSD